MTVPSQSTEDKDLGSLFATLIGIQERVDPKIITPLWIHKQREKRFYPDTRYGHTSYGTTISLSRNDYAEIEQLLDDVLSSL